MKMEQRRKKEDAVNAVDAVEVEWLEKEGQVEKEEDVLVLCKWL